MSECNHDLEGWFYEFDYRECKECGTIEEFMLEDEFKKQSKEIKALKAELKRYKNTEGFLSSMIMYLCDELPEAKKLLEKTNAFNFPVTDLDARKWENKRGRKRGQRYE